MKNKNDSDWTFTVRMHKIAAHSRISRGLTHRLLVLHSWACLNQVPFSYTARCREIVRIVRENRTLLQAFIILARAVAT